jgi:hypothetical protein
MTYESWMITWRGNLWNRFMNRFIEFYTYNLLYEVSGPDNAWLWISCVVWQILSEVWEKGSHSQNVVICKPVTTLSHVVSSSSGMWKKLKVNEMHTITEADSLTYSRRDLKLSLNSRHYLVFGPCLFLVL